MNAITIEQARFDMRCDDEVTDAQVQDLIDRAAGIVFDYVKQPLPLDDAPVSPVILSAVRLVAVGLFEDPSSAADPLRPSIKNLLRRSRDPALA